MFYTYILRSESDPTRHYMGRTADLNQRLAHHNGGMCKHTAKYRPWRIQCYFAFDSEAVALRFERYLKSGSGRAFARRHFESDPDD